MKKFPTTRSVALLLFLSCIFISWSATPPDFLTLTTINQGQGNYAFHLTWKSGGGSPDQFKIYWANSNTTNTADFELHSVEPALGSDTSEYEYYKNIPIPASGDYSFYLTAMESGIESSPSSFKHYTFNQPPYVRFTSTPPTDVIYVGDNFSYTATAEVVPNGSGSVSFSVLSGPPGLNIGTTSGVVSWTPTNKGRFYAILQASLAGDPTIFDTQTLTIVVYQCHDFGTIAGTVVDENSVPMIAGEIRVYEKLLDSSTYHWEQIATTNIQSDGTYSIELDGGDYYLHASDNSFTPEWYQDKTTQQTSDPVTVTCGNTSTANFVVHSLAPKFNVSGKVTKESDGTGLGYALVKFYGMQAGETNPSLIDSTEANSNGDYNILLTNTHDYKAMATGPNSDSAHPNVEYYQNQFWDHVANPNAASLVAASGNTDDISNINFSLSGILSNQNKLYGKVTKTSGGTDIPSWVIIFNIGGCAPEDLYGFRTFDAIATEGNFEFNGLAPGDYIIQSIPQDYTYIPGYYSSAGTVVPNWNDAGTTTITIGTTTQSGSHNVQHASGPGNIGEGVFNGTIVGDGIGLTIKKDKSENAQGAEPQPAALVYIMEKGKSKIINAAASNNTGNFKIEGLALKDYDVIIDKVGYHKQISTFKLDEKNKSVTQEIVIIPSTVGVDEDFPVPFVAVYPNPATNFIQLDFISGSNEITVEFINALGESINKYVLPAQIGENKVSIDTKDYLSGIYIIRISDNRLTRSIPVVISR